MAKKPRIAVVDYQMGNLHSVSKALVLTGADVTVTSDPSAMRTADIVCLPGVGAFGAAMTNLRKARLDEMIRGWIANGRPYLGICLGLQLLFATSEEDAGVSGLGVLPGKVVSFKKKDFKADDYRIPHMGWNTLDQRGEAAETIFDGLRADDRVYFVHTYYPVPVSADVISTTTPYGKDFCSSVATGRIFACQFHPEKSGEVGLRLLSNAVNWLAGAPIKTENFRLTGAAR